MIELLASTTQAGDTLTHGHVYDGKLDPVAWVIVAVMLGIILGGLAWCFYRAVTATRTGYEEQLPDEV